MKTLSINIIIFLFFSFQFCFAQEKESITAPYNEKPIALIDTKEGIVSMNSNFYSTKSHTNLIHQQIINTVQVQQIGDNNNINSQFSATKIEATLTQQGNNNQLFIDKNANSIYQKVIQQGNNNRVQDYVPYANYDITTELFQKGNDQNIINFGSNSISKNMTIIQSGNGAAVTVINHTKL